MKTKFGKNILRGKNKMPYTEKQRRWACSQMGKSRKSFKGKPSLTQKQAKEMCTGPLKEQEEILKEIEKYFNNNKDDDYLEFDDHPLSNPKDLMDPNKPAPWDHLTNTEDDGDVDIDIQERITK